MSSFHQDRLLVEGSGPVTGSATALPTTRGTSRRAVGSTEKKAISKVPTQRPGTAQRIEATQSTAATPAAPRAKRATGAKAAAVTGALASRAKAATVKAATAKAATAKAATVKAATAKAATARAATAKAATAARTAAVTTVANHTAGVRSARAAAAAPAAPAAKGRATKLSAAKAAPAGAVKPAPAAKAAAKPVADAKAPVVNAPTAEATAAKPVAAGKPAPTAKPAATKAAPVAKAATVKVAAEATSPAPAKVAATAKAAPAAKPAASAKTAASEPSGAKAATGESSGAKATATAPRVRPTPHKRIPAVEAAVAGSVPLTDVAELAAADTADVVVRKDFPADPPVPASGSRLPLFLRRRPPMVGRRPTLYLAAALVGAISLSAFSAQEPSAQATATMSQSVSVAEQLGIEAAPTGSVIEVQATERLSELVASRNTRDAEQAAAMQVQAEADRLAAEAAAEAARPKAVMPVAGARLTSGFGARWGTLHAGIDLAAPMHTPEYAVMDGVVLEAGPASGYGLVVYIQHENGDVTVYGHMDEILVETGQVVRAGDTIALLGNRGQSTGPHLHFEVHVGGLDGKKVDPLPWLRDKGVDI